MPRLLAVLTLLFPALLGAVQSRSVPKVAAPLRTPASVRTAAPTTGPRALPRPAIAPLPDVPRPAPTPEASGQPSIASQDAADERSVSLAGQRFDGAGLPDLLSRDRPSFSPAHLARIQKVNALLEGAASEAAAAALDPSAAVISRGSSARQTFDQSNPDFDLMVKLPSEAALSLHGPSETVGLFQKAMHGSLSRLAQAAFPGRKVQVSIGRRRGLMHPKTKMAEPGVVLLKFKLRVEGELAADADVTLTHRKDYANPYPELFREQLARVEEAGGRPAVERLLSDIRLAKRFFREAVGAYKFYQGGPTGVGIEQMVIQAGSFDGMMERLHETAYAEPGQARPGRLAWNVPNPYMEPANFLELITPQAWARIGSATEKYRQAKAAGRPLRISELGRQANAPSDRVLRLRLKADPGARPGLIIRALERLRRRLNLARRPAFNLDRRTGSVDLALLLAPEASRSAQLRLVELFFQQGSASGLKLIGAETPDRGAAAAAPANARSAPGRATLDLLEKFTLTGPKPSERGDAFLYAQGAKELDPGLEAAWKDYARSFPAPVAGETRVRALLRRGGEGGFIRVAQSRGDGKERMMPVSVPEALSAGIPSESLIEARLVGGRVTGVRPIGSYPVDMVIGRVVRGPQGRPMLDSLLRQEGRRVSVYPALPLSGEARPGEIVQAFVRPNSQGFEAVPLIALGSKITPEIAAREAALRHGARGYFDKTVIEQAERTARDYAPEASFRRMASRARAAGRKAEDLRALPFITVDPIGAGDLDDAYYTERRADGSWTWYLATADVSRVAPGTPAFRAAARIGNTFYSIDKDGVPEYPMNHPLVSKYTASLLAGKDSLAMVSKMRFSADGTLLPGESEVFLGLVKVQGRYTYEQVHELWKGAAEHGISHVDQVQLTRELANLLHRQDDRRGKLDFDLPEVHHRKGPAGWTSVAEREPALLKESHRLIEELKVYGNRLIGAGLNAMTSDAGVPHVSRVHPPQEEIVNQRLREDLARMGVPWKDGPLAEYLARLRAREDLPAETKEAAQLRVLVTRRSAVYAAQDAEGHEGLALEAGSYDHPSTPIRRFSDLLNRTLVQASLEGRDPRQASAAILDDLKSLGFDGLEDYLDHLNGRAAAARVMDAEVDEFMSVYELAQPENRGRTFKGWVKLVRGGRNPTATIALEGSAATITVRGPEAPQYRLLEKVQVLVRGADVESLRVDARITKLPR